MIRNPASMIPITTQSIWRIGRRDFLRHCGFVGVAGFAAAALAACESGGRVQAIPPSGGFFADGTDFAD
jgi:hypothetical protein